MNQILLKNRKKPPSFSDKMKNFPITAFPKKKLNPVFTNRTLNMRKIQAVGFDMDHTLVQYNIQNFESKTHQILIQKLIQEKGYPKRISNLKFEKDRIVRGLVIDTQKGNFLKLSRYRSIRTIFHGKTQIHYQNRRSIYPADYIDFGASHDKFSFVESHFSTSSSLLYMQLIDLKKEGLILPEPQVLFQDVCETSNHVHNNKDVKNHVMESPHKYIYVDPRIALQLEKWIKHGKQLFLLTNSSAEYTSFLMNYTISPYLKEHSSWMDIFKIAITSAEKPHFFHQKKDFQKLDPKTFQTLASLPKVENSGIYQGGCSQGLTEALGLIESEILYIGDQVYTDVVLLKQKCGWRTALVIEELDEERKKTTSHKQIYKDIQKMMDRKTPNEAAINQLVSDQIENNHKNHSLKIKSLIEETEKLDQLLSAKIKEINKVFNPFWGELMRVGAEESLLASQAERFSCIYMPYLIDFLSQSPRSYYRAKKRLFPHEM